MLRSRVCLHACALRNKVPQEQGCHMRQSGCSRFLGRSEYTCGTRARQEDSVGFEPTASQHLRAGSTTELSPTPNVFRQIAFHHLFWIKYFQRMKSEHNLPILCVMPSELSVLDMIFSYLTIASVCVIASPPIMSTASYILGSETEVIAL